MKILSIGNSFSQDAHYYLHDLAASMGEDFTCVNLYIGGCSLETHCSHILDGEAAYDYELNGKALRKTALKDAVCEQAWDVVTVQQASHFSGRPQSYVPYLSTLCDFVRSCCPSAKLYFHETWAYEAHPCFADYDCNQHEMFRRIGDAAQMASKSENLPLIPSGSAIQYLRDKVPQFFRPITNLSLCRDGFHLSMDYGRYAAALCFFGALSGRDVRQVAFAPENTDAVLIEEIKKAVAAVLQRGE